MNTPISVTTLNNQIKAQLETTFISSYVEGEISNLTYHNSGHIYFSLKDKSSTISCVMFKGNAKYLRFQLEVGLKVILSASITVYTPRGSYQLNCTKVEPQGQGSLALAYEQLKEKLKNRGYFNKECKKSLPKYPKEIVLVTSPTGAAIEDMKKVALNRWPLTKFILVPCLVQGEGAKEDLVEAIKTADNLNPDLIIVGRGGGSIEDLWAFNEENVAKAIFETKVVIISAVGHESDFLISDFVADVRASTPSNAIEIALPDINEHRLYLDNLSNEFVNRYKVIISKNEQLLRSLKYMFEQNSIESKCKLIQIQIQMIKDGFNNYFIQKINQKNSEIRQIKNNFILLDPSKKLLKGYAQISKNNKIINIESVCINDEISIQSAKSSLICKVLEIKNF